MAVALLGVDGGADAGGEADAVTVDREAVDRDGSDDSETVAAGDSDAGAAGDRDGAN